MQIEQWRAIAEAPDYEVSNTGAVRRVVPDWQGKYLGRILSPGLGRGYARYVLCVDGKKISRSAHSLVCIAFNGPRPDPTMHCAHRDGDKSNNTPPNLYWATPLENAQDRDRHGRTRKGPYERPRNLPVGERHWTRATPDKIPKGEAHYCRTNPDAVPKGSARHNSKLTESDIRAIRSEPARHGSGRALSDKYAVSMALITAIRKGRAWTHVK